MTRMLVPMLCSAVALAGCTVGTPATPASGTGQGTYGEYYYLGVFRPTGGTIVSSDGRINCGVQGDSCGDAQGQTRYSWNEAAVLTAIAAPGNRFDGWAGDCSGKGECRISTVEKRADSYVVAVFAPDAIYRNVYFTVTVERPAGGTISSSDSRIYCGAASSASRCGAALFPWEGTATLTAVPDAGWTFTGWTGDCSGTEATCVLDTSVNATDKMVAAQFAQWSDGEPLAWDQGSWDQVIWQ